MAQAISQRYLGKGVAAFACHPGVVDTGIWPDWLAFRSWFMLNESQGASTQLYQATAREMDLMDFVYMEPSAGQYPKSVVLGPLAQDAASRDRLWDESARIVSAFSAPLSTA